MKKISDKAKHLCILSGLSVLSVFIVFGVRMLTKEPDTEFTPLQEETGSVTDTWEEEASYPELLTAGNILDNTTTDNAASAPKQVPCSEVAESSEPNVFVQQAPVSLSASTRKESGDDIPPKEKPVTTDSLIDPDKQPEYDISVPLHTEIKDFKEPENNNNAAVTSSGQVYDPVFGWIQTGDTNQNVVDSSGDIDKQIGTMGN